MSELMFYRAWLLVPIAVPILLMVLGPITPTPPEPWLTIWVHVFMSLVFGGPAYVILAMVVWYWLPDQPASHVRLVALGMPLPIIAVNELLVHGPTRFVIGMAYGYVVAFLLTEPAVRAIRWVRRTDSEEVAATYDDVPE